MYDGLCYLFVCLLGDIVLLLLVGFRLFLFLILCCCCQIEIYTLSFSLYSPVTYLICCNLVLIYDAIHISCAALNFSKPSN